RFVEAPDRVAFRHPAAPQSVELREDVPDPVGAFPAGLELVERSLVVASLSFDEAIQVPRIIQPWRFTRGGHSVLPRNVRACWSAVNTKTSAATVCCAECTSGTDHAHAGRGGRSSSCWYIARKSKEFHPSAIWPFSILPMTMPQNSTDFPE